jgi:hypothetical protein
MNTERQTATKRIFAAEAPRHGEKQSQDRRAQRWQRPQREDPLGDRRFSAFGSPESSRLARMLTVRSAERQTATKRIFAAEPQRHGEKQSQDRKAQRWQRPQREDPLGDRRLSAYGSRESSRLARIVSVRSTERQTATKRIFTTEPQRHGEKQSQDRKAQRWQRPQREDPLGDRRFSAFGSRESSRLARMLTVRSAERQTATKRIFAAEAPRHGEKQSQDRRAQRWQRPQREDPLGDRRLSAYGSRASSRLARMLTVSRADKTKTCFLRAHPCPSVSLGSWPCA